MSETLYTSIRALREESSQPCHRVLLAVYANQETIKRQSLSLEAYIIETVKPFSKNIASYVYIKGVFYIHILQTKDLAYINSYLETLHNDLQKKTNFVNSIRVVHQSYQNPTTYFNKSWECDNNQQPGPILSESDKTEDQIEDRSFEIYELFIDGAKKKKENSSHKIGTMILLSNEDMSILVSHHFMSLAEYVQLYIQDIDIDREEERNYPLPPSIFEAIQFLETDNYQSFSNN